MGANNRSMTKQEINAAIVELQIIKSRAKAGLEIQDSEHGRKTHKELLKQIDIVLYRLALMQIKTV